MPKWFKLSIFVTVMTDFSVILADAFDTVASEHGLSYSPGGALAWGQTGAAYLSYILCSLKASSLRELQYAARETTGPVLLDCKWYDRLTELCLNGKESADVCLPLPQGGNSVNTISKELFLEMLDFCREG